jgi:light-regulated signal transduction histidine kinase (bacteriophytochrome)
MDAVSENLINHCEFEQLHLSGAIQSFGALLRVETKNNIITHASENLAHFSDVNPQDVIGKSIDTLGWFNTKYLDDLPHELGKTKFLSHIATGSQEQIDAMLIRGEACILIELEKNETKTEVIPVQQLQHPLLSAPLNKNDLLNYHALLLDAFRKITHFDRVMIYRFLDDWSGEVIAEATAEGIGSYLGLHFPATDIPQIARDLYLKNPSRLIQDAKADAVPILGMDESIPDLTWSDLRSVSPVHLEYLEHMGVYTSFSVPIRLSGNLWGLVACHNLTSKMISPDQRHSCISITNAYALGVAYYLSSQRLQALDSVDRRIDKILEALSEYDDLLEGIECSGELLTEALNAESFAMVVNDDVIILGESLDLDTMSIVDNWFVNNEAVTYITDNLSSVFADSPETLKMASGMIAIKVRSPKSNWVRFYWFRPEEPQEVTWAGNPNKPMVENAGVQRLSPRRSFEKWVEIKTGYSRPWTSEEKMTATKFRNTLMRWL